MGKTKIMMILFSILTLIIGVVLVSDIAIKINKRKLDNWTWNDNWNGNGPTVKERKEEKKDNSSNDESIKDSDNNVANNYEEAIRKSKETNKNILLFFTADWCPYCIKMKTESLSNKDVQESLKNYILLTVDAGSDNGLVKKFDINSLPSFVVLDKNEQKIKFKKGFIKYNEFINWLN